MKISREHIIDLIFSFSKEHTAFETLESHLAEVDQKELPPMLLECGVLPEVFNHDSTEEKLWAKYSDILISKSFELLGLKSRVIRVRGDSADVFAETENYTVAGRAVGFALEQPLHVVTLACSALGILKQLQYIKSSVMLKHFA
jgi:type II restriction enzyme